jgi:esterase/lipase
MLAWAGIFLCCILIVIYFMGPKVNTDTTIRPIALPSDLDEYLKESEAAFTDIVPGTEKTIIWAGEAGVRTPLAVIYLHGFSATRQETNPLSDIVAKEFRANLFYTRFTGHGRTNEALREGSVNAWINDIHEAMEIGRRLGEKIILIGLSTGATAATWLATQSMAEDVASFILISPNFGLADKRSKFLTLPWAGPLAEGIFGPEYGWAAHNALHHKYWTHRFPTRALLPMLALVKLATSQDLHKITKPLLIIFSPEDKVVDVRAIPKIYRRIGSVQKQLVAYSARNIPNSHVLAGNILAPDSTQPIADTIIQYLKSVMPAETESTSDRS